MDNKMKTCVIYHSIDLDGWMSAAIVKLKYPDVQLLGWNYGDPIPDLSEYDKIIMCDVSFDPPEMMKLQRENNLIWLDHHISAIRKVYEYYANNGNITDLHGFQDPKKAACELTWEFFFDQPMPEIVRLLGRYDCFCHKGTNEEQRVLEFQYGARQCISNPEDALNYLKNYLESDYQAVGILETIQFEGQAIYGYLRIEAKQKYAKKFDAYFNGYLFACVNAERFNPINFGINYHEEGYDGFASFWYENGKWAISFYNDNREVDCSEIAGVFGGGGHKGAAGARLDFLDSFCFYNNQDKSKL